MTSPLPYDVTTLKDVVCTLDLANHADGVYILRTTTRGHGTEAPIATNAEAASRLLMQATFGPTRDAIAKVLSMAGDSKNGSARVDDTNTDMAMNWIKFEMDKPRSYHRAYLRRRQNPRVVGQPYAGRIIDTCEMGSRWHGARFSTDDANGPRLLA
jgi:hypothetical protein